MNCAGQSNDAESDQLGKHHGNSLQKKSWAMINFATARLSPTVTGKMNLRKATDSKPSLGVSETSSA
jgi:hypothetical protein